MIVCCYAETIDLWNEEKFNSYLSLIPQQIRIDTLKKKNIRDIQLSIAGKLLLIEVLKRLNNEKRISLKNLRIDDFKRPYISPLIDFNIAHSGNIAICCGTDSGRIGVDIEIIRDVEIDDYSEYFTKPEWKSINGKHEIFFDYWARKEAILKAAGTGFQTPLIDVDVSDDIVKFNNNTYYLSHLKTNSAYKGYLAVTVKQDIEFNRIAL